MIEPVQIQSIEPDIARQIILMQHLTILRINRHRPLGKQYCPLIAVRFELEPHLDPSKTNSRRKDLVVYVVQEFLKAFDL